MWCRRSDNRRRPYRKHPCCEDALHIALVRQSILDPVAVPERGLGTIQRIFDIAVLIKKIRKIHEHTGFIEFGDL